MATRRKSKPARASREARRLATLRSLLAGIVESSGDAIFSRKLDGTVSTWNTAAERIFGYRAAEIVGKSSVILLPADRRDETQQLMARIRRGQRVDHFTTIRARKDGKPLHVSLCVSPIRNERGRIVGASTIARDITTERELEESVLRAGERERQRLGQDLHDGLGQHLGGVELLSRTLAASLAKRGRPEARTAQLVVQQVREAIAQARALARGLTPVIENPNGLMLALEDFCASTRALFRIECVFRCDEPVLIDDHATAVHLFRIAQESVANAMRHGGARWVRIELARRAGMISLEICDRGAGLPPGWEDGDGMGFRIMNYRASVIGGSLRVERVSRRGVRITCRVPATTARLS